MKCNFEIKHILSSSNKKYDLNSIIWDFKANCYVSGTLHTL